MSSITMKNSSSCKMHNLRLSLNDLFAKQKVLIDSFFDRVNVEQMQALLDHCLSCKGSIVFSGIGKSGYVAEKIAMTMLSTGTKAFYLSAMNALHGDISLVQQEDLFICFSKSGESEELLNLLPFLRNKGVFIVALVCKENSSLARGSDMEMLLPCEKELCPFDLAPTTSASVQMIFGDILTTALMEAKDFSLDQYVQNHPSGRIGKQGRRSMVKVEDLKLPLAQTPLCQAENTLLDVLEELSHKRCGCILVIDEAQKLLGIFTDGDLRRALQEKGSDCLKHTMRDLMTKKPKSIQDNCLAYEALKVMEKDPKNPITVLAVLDVHKKVTGIIKMHDLIQAGL